MENNYFKSLFTLLLLLCSIVVSAAESERATPHDFAVDGIYYNILSQEDKTVEVTYKGTDYQSFAEYWGNVVIPASVSYENELYSVVRIGDCAFDRCSNLTCVEIPNSVTSIGEYAFSGCSGLTSIEIPNSVTSIGKYAFFGCDKLAVINVATNNEKYKSVDGVVYTKDMSIIVVCPITAKGSFSIPNSVTSIGDYAFYDCRGLTSIEIPNSVTSIGDFAFSDCSSLTSIAIPNSVTSIEKATFFNCRSLTSIAIPNSITSIGDHAFSRCNSLTSIEIPNSVTSIGNSAFYDCSGLTSIEIPNSVTSIGNSTFSGCSGLTSIEIPNSVTSIGDYAFRGCAGLTSIEIPNSVTSIGDYAFSDCRSLTSIAISNSVTSIGDYAFRYCSSLTSIEIPNSVTSIGDYAFSYCSSLTSIVLSNSVTSIGDHAFSECYNLTSIQIPDSVTTIGGYAFSGCSSLTSIVLSNSVKSIGDGAFSGCSGLTSIEIPNSVTSIGDYAFRGCAGLTSIVIPNSVTSIGGGAFESTDWFNNLPDGLIYLGRVLYKYKGTMPTNTHIEIPNSISSVGAEAFSGCTGLTSIVIPNSVTSIGESAFSGCSSLTRIQIPDSVTTIGYEAFIDCSSLTSIAIPNSVTSIGNRTFNCCRSLTSIEIPNSVISIGDYAFSGCNSLTSVEIPNSVTSIGDHAFYSCSALTSIEIPNSVTSIGNSAFSGCSGLTSIEIPNSVTSIGKYTFSGCSSLTSIAIPNSVTSIGLGAFNDCSSLTSIQIPDSVTTIGGHAFSGCSSLTSIVIPSNVITIGSYAFSGCSSLTCIELLNSGISTRFSISIGYNAFDNCLNLLSFISHIPADILTFVSGSFQYLYENGCTLYVPYGTKNIYATRAGWKDFKNIVEFRNTYKATFIVGDKEFAIVSILEGDTITYPEVPEKEGYTLKWEPALEIMPSNDITIIGRYVVNKYLLTYKVDDEVYASDSIDYGATIEPIAEPAKVGHTFSGWSDIPATMPAEDVVVEGSFSINKYLLTYKVDGAVYASDSIDYGATIEPIAEPAKEGHTFSGWSDIPATMPAEDVIIEGNSTVNKYLLTYKVDDEVYASDSIDYGATIEPIAEPAKEGHTFSGWSDIPATMPAEDVVVEGSFSVNKYLLIYKVDDEVYASDSIDYGATIEPIAEPTKEGHTFSGWSDIPATMPAEDVVVEGSFSINSYTVTFMVDGEVYETITVEYGATIEPIEAPTKEGHTFKGWSDIPATMPAEDIVVEANFAVNSYAVILMIDGNLYKIITVEYGAEIELPTPPEKEGYVFTGWIDVPATMPAEDIIIEGSYKVNTGISAVGLDLEKNEVYNLKGQRVTESENLTRGIYIVNGKKVYVK